MRKIGRVFKGLVLGGLTYVVVAILCGTLLGVLGAATMGYAFLGSIYYYVGSMIGNLLSIVLTIIVVMKVANN